MMMIIFVFVCVSFYFSCHTVAAEIPESHPMCFIGNSNSCRCENGPLLILLLPIWWFCYRNRRFLFLFFFFTRTIKGTYPSIQTGNSTQWSSHGIG